MAYAAPSGWVEVPQTARGPADFCLVRTHRRQSARPYTLSEATSTDCDLARPREHLTESVVVQTLVTGALRGSTEHLIRCGSCT
jgi:hypothetical protein